MHPRININQFIQHENGSILSYAVTLNNSGAVKELLAAGASVHVPVDSMGYSPIAAAIISGKPNLVRLMIQSPTFDYLQIHGVKEKLLALARQGTRQEIAEILEQAAASALPAPNNVR